MKCCTGNCHQGRWCEKSKQNGHMRIDNIKTLMYNSLYNFNIMEMLAIIVAVFLMKV
jgi:hypothetical protein